MVVLRRLLVGLALLIAGVFAAAPQYSVGPISAVDAVVDSIAPQAQALTPSQRIILKRGISPVASWSAATDPFPSAILSHSRTSLATMFDSTGKLTYAPNNLLTYSQTWSNAAWSKTAATVVVNLLTDDTSTGAHLITGSNAGISFGANVIFAVWASKNTRTQIALQLGADVAYFDLDAGTVISGAKGGIVDVGDGSYICFIKTVPSNNNTIIYLASGGTVSYTGTGNGSVYIYDSYASAVTYETTPRTGDLVTTASAAYYGPRIDYDPNTLAVKGLLIEEARTNYCPYSSALSSWSVSNGTVTNNSGATLDPAGTNTATLINPTGGSNTSLASPSFAATGSTLYVASYFVKSAGAGFVQIGFYDSTNALLYVAAFDLSTGANTFASAGVTALTSVNIGNGWWRLSATWTSAVSTAAIIPVVYPKSSGVGAPPTASDKIYVWGPQYEKGTATSSYVANASTGTTARAADVVQFIGAALTALQGSAFSAIGEAQTISAPTVQAVLFGANSSVAFVYAPSANNQAALYDGTSLIAVATAGGGRTWSGLARAGIGVSGSTASEVMTGGTVATGSHALPARTTAYLGTYSGGAYLNGWVKSFAIYNQRLADGTLQSKSVVNAAY